MGTGSVDSGLWLCGPSSGPSGHLPPRGKAVKCIKGASEGSGAAFSHFTHYYNSRARANLCGLGNGLTFQRKWFGGTEGLLTASIRTDPSTPLRFAQDDREKGSVLIMQLITRVRGWGARTGTLEQLKGCSFFVGFASLPQALRASSLVIGSLWCGA